MPSRDEIRRQLCAVISDIQVEAGSVQPTLSDDLRPMRDLPGFDSLCGVDAEVRLSDALGIEVQQIPFKARGRDQTISEIVESLSATLGGGTNE